MYTQDFSLSILYETERRKDEMAEAQASCRARQLLQDRAEKHPSHLPAIVLNLLLIATTFIRRTG